VPAIGAFPPIELKMMELAVEETTVANPPVPILPVPLFAVIIVPGGIAEVPETPVIVPFHDPFGCVVILPTPTTGDPEIGQKFVVFENGTVAAPGSIGMTLRLMTNDWGEVVVFVSVIVGFCPAAVEITDDVLAAGLVTVQTYFNCKGLLLQEGAVEVLLIFTVRGVQPLVLFTEN